MELSTQLFTTLGADLGDRLLKWIITAILGLLGFTVSFGCAPNTEPLERVSNTLITEVIKPAGTKATEELATRSAQMQGQVSAINPGYRIHGFANFGPGVAYDFVIETQGVSANLAGATQSDQGPDLKKPLKTVIPAITTPKENLVFPATQEAE